MKNTFYIAALLTAGALTLAACEKKQASEETQTLTQPEAVPEAMPMHEEPKAEEPKAEELTTDEAKPEEEPKAE